MSKARPLTKEDLLAFDDRPIEEFKPDHWPDARGTLLIRSPPMAAVLNIANAQILTGDDEVALLRAQDVFVGAGIVGADGVQLLTPDEAIRFIANMSPADALKLTQRVQELSGIGAMDDSKGGDPKAGEDDQNVGDSEVGEDSGAADPPLTE